MSGPENVVPMVVEDERWLDLPDDETPLGGSGRRAAPVSCARPAPPWASPPRARTATCRRPCPRRP
ncbi:hypothetical protein NKH77_38720 [Streptomyces sp. M19]